MCRPEACKVIKKEALAQVFSCEFWEIFKNTFLTENLRSTASKCIKTILKNNGERPQLQHPSHNQLELLEFHQAISQGVIGKKDITRFHKKKNLIAHD